MASNTTTQPNNEPSNAELWALLQEQRTEIERLQAQVEQQTADARPAPPAPGGRARRNRILSRAGLLKSAAAGAVGLGGLALTQPERAAADVCGTGDAWFTADGQWSGDFCIVMPAGFYTVYPYVNSHLSFGVLASGGKAGVYGESLASTSENGWSPTVGPGIGVYGAGDTEGVHGLSTNGPGVVGISTNDKGVNGESTNGHGVDGSSTSSVGVYGTGAYGVWGDPLAESSVGVVAGAGGRAQLSLVPSNFSGPPAIGTNYLGDVFVTKDGRFYRCLATGTGQFAPLNSVVPLLQPVRALDTRTGLNCPAGRRHNGETLTLVVAGGTFGGQPIPSQAIGIVANLRAFNPSQNGWLAIYPLGSVSGTPGFSNLNFTPSGAPPYAIANQATVGLSSGGLVGGSMQIYVSVANGGSTDVVLDLLGYIV